MRTAIWKIYGVIALAVVAGIGEGALRAQSAPEARDQLRNRPLAFEENRGQTDSRVRFLARGEGYLLFLTPSEAVVRLRSLQGEASAASALRLRWLGARALPGIAGERELPGASHYLIGRSPADWKTGIPSYARVSYRGVYPGIDLAFYGNPRQLEYDFVVEPGADPGAIRLELLGAERIAIDESGDLVLSVGAQEVRLRKPVSYQEVGGARRKVETAYRLEAGARRVQFELAAYDTARPLVIDPVLSYSTYLGGSEFDEGTSVAVDPRGNVYVAGVTASPDFPTTPGALQTGYRHDDAFAVKLDREGALVYATYLGGSLGEWASGIAVDPRGSAYLAGGTFSPDFPLVNPLPVPVDEDGNDAFVAKLDPSGSALIYSTRLGGTEMDGATAIAVDSQGHAYVCGNTSSPDFPTSRAIAPSFHGWTDMFVTKLSPGGSSLVYSTYLGGSRLDQARAIALDPAGNVYLAGDTGSPDFPVVQAAQTALRGVDDAFVLKIHRSGSFLVYSTYLGGHQSEEGFAVAADPAGNAYVTGDTWSADFPTLNALQPAEHGLPEAFVTKLRPGGALAYSTYLGGSDSDRGSGIVASPSGTVFVAGFTTSGNFPLADPLQAECLPRVGTFCAADVFVTELDPSGARILFSTYLGGTAWDGANAIARGPRGELYLTGFTASADFPVVHAVQPQFGGGEENTDAFVTKIEPGNGKE